MSKFTLFSIFCTFIWLNAADYTNRVVRSLEHDRKVIDCAVHKREALQHSCVLAPITTEGPYFLIDDLKRSDISEGQIGLPLELAIRLTNAKDCSPISGFFVHIWSANATGIYSGVDSKNADIDAFRPTPASDDRFLRGYQETDANGEVKFKTIIPGWYTNRAIHVHIEVYSKDITDPNRITYIGQFYFERELPLQLKTINPYSTNTQEITFNDQDEYYLQDDGPQTTLDLQLAGDKVESFITVAIDPTVVIHVS